MNSKTPQCEVRPIDRVPCEPGLWVTAINTVVSPLGNGVAPPLHASMLRATLTTASILTRLVKK